MGLVRAAAVEGPRDRLWEEAHSRQVTPEPSVTVGALFPRDVSVRANGQAGDTRGLPAFVVKAGRMCQDLLQIPLAIVTEPCSSHCLSTFYNYKWHFIISICLTGPSDPPKHPQRARGEPRGLTPCAQASLRPEASDLATAKQLAAPTGVHNGRFPSGSERGGPLKFLRPAVDLGLRTMQEQLHQRQISGRARGARGSSAHLRMCRGFMGPGSGCAQPPAAQFEASG